MRRLKPLPHQWLISDERNDALLEGALRRLPRGSGFIYRHYHLGDPARWQRFQQLKRVAKASAHTVVLADSAITAREWGADGIYGAPLALWPTRSGLLRLATAHNLTEIALANRKRADAVLLSPIFSTRSHPDAMALGATLFRLMARRARMPVIALGGMTRARAKSMNGVRWAAIDGLS